MILPVRASMIELVRTSALARYWHAGRPATMAAGGVTATERPFLAKRLLRGQPASWREPLRAQLQLELPGPSTVTTGSGLCCLWLRPDEWLIVGGTGAAGLALAALSPPDGVTGAVIDVSDRYQCLELQGERAAELLNGGCSVDFSERAFPAGHCCQTRIEEVPVIISRPDASARFDVMPERALADYLWRWVVAAAYEFPTQAEGAPA